MDRSVTPAGRRSSTARGYLDQARGRPNLTIVHPRPDRPDPVRGAPRGRGRLPAQGRVDDGAGAPRGAGLLRGDRLAQSVQRSGVGPPTPARPLRHPGRAGSPGWARTSGSPGDLRPVRMPEAGLAGAGAETLQPARSGRNGVSPAPHRRQQPVRGGGLHPVERTIFGWPNLQYHFLPLAINYNGSNAIETHGFQAHVGSMRSPSRGRVRPPPAIPTIIRASCSTTCRRSRIGASSGTRSASPARSSRNRRSTPIAAARSARDRPCGAMPRSTPSVRAHGETAYHPSCSCKMGTDAMAVVDAEGRVHGLEGLRVVDASIMRLIVTGNLNAPTIMMAEKIADRIRGRARCRAATRPTTWRAMPPSDASPPGRPDAGSIVLSRRVRHRGACHGPVTPRPYGSAIRSLD